MKKRIAVLDSDEKQCLGLCAMLEEQGYPATPMGSIPYLEKQLQTNAFQVVIFDLDTIAVENRVIRQLALKNPGICILGLSRERFHPELKDAICYHIFACINKPLDPEELFYWLNCIYENEVNSTI